MLDQLRSGFNRVFNHGPTHTFFAPGRINLIGEHIDYNGGYVFPCAITYGTYALVSLRDDQECHVYSENFKELGVITFDLSDLANKKEHDWANYPKGVLEILRRKGYQVSQGFNIYYYGNIPNGAGLSSSASIEMVTCWLVNELFDLGLSRVECVLIGKEVENDYIGVNSGIMDQFAIVMGQIDQAMLLNTNTLEHQMVPLELKDASIVISNTNKRRGLTDSQYNERRSECEVALSLIQGIKQIDYLCDLNNEEFNQVKHVLKDDVYLRRARHAVSENQRTILASKVLQEGDIEGFGKLMNESHVSLRDDYEVTGIELDTLVEAAWEHEGTIGSRVTGAGFGGCSISIVKNDQINDFIKTVGEKYQSKIGYEATFYVASVGKGAHQID